MIWTIYVLKKLNIKIFLIKGGSGTQFPGFLSFENWGGGGGGVLPSQSFGYLEYQCCKLHGTGYCMGISYRVYQMDIPYRAYYTICYSKLRCHSTNLRQEYSFLLFIKAFISLYVFQYHQCNDFIFFSCVFHGLLENTDTFILASHSKHGPWRAVGCTILTERTFL